MSQLFAVNDDNDIYTEANGNVAFVSGLEAVAQNCEQAMKAQLGEMIYDKSAGVNYQGTLFSSSGNVVGFTASARAALALVPDVLGVESFRVYYDGNTAKYQAVIETPYGTERIENVL